MSIVVLKLPEVKSTASRPKRCPACKHEALQRWGGQVKPVRDPQIKAAQVYRYRCCRCGHTFRHYPAGLSQAQQSERLRRLAGLGWVLGLSFRGIAGLFAAFGVVLSRMTAWRDQQAWAEQLTRRQMQKPVRVLGLDGAYVRGCGAVQPVLVAVDLGTGQPVAVGYVDEKDPQAVQRWLAPVVQQLGVSVIVTDDLLTYRSVARQLDLEHQVCQFHVRRWVGRALHDLRLSLAPDWHWVLDEIKTLLAELPIQGSRRLVDLYRLIPARFSHTSAQSPLERLRLLLIRLSECWPSYRLFDWQPEVPWTNNCTEQVIGRMKMRSHSVRGYKSAPTMLAGLIAAGAWVY
ncbi:MAG TPA: transposase [Anaerolineales bacterium]|nr:transposase [Anaerolineales bacterium]